MEYLASEEGDKLLVWYYSNSKMILTLLYKLYNELKGDRVFIIEEYA